MSDEKNKKQILLKTTFAIGDTIMVSALISKLFERGYIVGVDSGRNTLKLLDGLDGYDPSIAVAYKNNKGLTVVDISDYFCNLPHSSSLPENFVADQHERKGHLCEWMAYSLWQKSGIKINPSKRDVKILLQDEEINFGRECITKISKESNKKVVVIAPCSTSKNRNIPKETLDKLIREISGFAVPCILGPVDNKYISCLGKVTVIENKDLRLASAVLYSSDAVVCVDSAPLHMFNAAAQGRNSLSLMDNIILVVGSSDPETVAYAKNKIIFSESGCPVSPCGCFGYADISLWEDSFKRKFYHPKNKHDRSGCIYNKYRNGEPVCMQNIDVGRIVDKVRDVLFN